MLQLRSLRARCLLFHCGFTLPLFISGRNRWSRPESQPEQDKASVADFDVTEWTVEDVSKWLKEEVRLSDEDVATFVKHDVDGEALIGLGRISDDAKELLPSIGARSRFFMRLDKVEKEHQQFERAAKPSNISMQDISITAYFNTIAMRVAFTPLLARDSLSRVTLVCYTSGGGRRGRYRRDDDDDAMFSTPKGQAHIMIDMRDVECSSMSNGGSGGEDNLTCNITFSPKGTIEFSVLGLGELKSFDLFCKNLHLSPDEKRAYQLSIDAGASSADHAMGVTIIKKADDTQTVHWGSHVRWTPATHRLFPQALKDILFQVLLVRNRQPDERFGLLNRHLMLVLFGHLAAGYNVNPFEDFPFPGTIIEDEDEADNN